MEKSLKLLFRSPETLLRNSHLRLHGLYYISKQIVPALSREINLVGADLTAWFAELPRSLRLAPKMSAEQPVPGALGRSNSSSSRTSRVTLDHYYSNAECRLCGCESPRAVCGHCREVNRLSHSCQTGLLIQSWRSVWLTSFYLQQVLPL